MDGLITCPTCGITAQSGIGDVKISDLGLPILSEAEANRRGYVSLTIPYCVRRDGKKMWLQMLSNTCRDMRKVDACLVQVPVGEGGQFEGWEVWRKL